MLSKEKLLIPRIKIIAPWPDMDKQRHYVGEIINLVCYDPATNQYFIQEGVNKTYDAFYNNYPHIFKPLEWYNERNPEDMPQYVKHNNGSVKAVDKWVDNNTIIVFKGGRIRNVTHWNASDETEYLTFINKIK